MNNFVIMHDTMTRPAYKFFVENKSQQEHQENKVLLANLNSPVGKNVEALEKFIYSQPFKYFYDRRKNFIMQNDDDDSFCIQASKTKKHFANIDEVINAFELAYIKRNHIPNSFLKDDVSHADADPIAAVVTRILHENVRVYAKTSQGLKLVAMFPLGSQSEVESFKQKIVDFIKVRRESFFLERQYFKIERQKNGKFKLNSKEFDTIENALDYYDKLKTEQDETLKTIFDDFDNFHALKTVKARSNHPDAISEHEAMHAEILDDSNWDFEQNKKKKIKTAGRKQFKKTRKTKMSKKLKKKS